MYQTGQFKRRRGVGSIIAGAFMVLIILTGYEYYLLNNRAQNDYQQVLNEVRTLDIERSQEVIKFTNIKHNGDNFELKIRNDGPDLVHFTYASIFKNGETSNDPYLPLTDAYLMPSEVSETIFLQYTENINPINNEYTIQIITERGNVIPIQYPQDTADYPYSYVLSGAISKVVGRVVPTYDTFKWGLIPKDDNTVPSMDSSWVVEYDNKDNHVFSVEVSHYGETELKLGKKTGLYFQSLTVGDPVQCYIVHYDEATNKIYSFEGNEITLPSFDPEDETPTPYTLYFATDDEGGDPISDSFSANQLNNGRRYQVSLGIFDDAEIYAQSFPLIAIEIVNEYD